MNIYLQYVVFLALLLATASYINIYSGGIAIKYLTRSERLSLIMPFIFILVSLLLFMWYLVLLNRNAFLR